jgi:branched-chain amino acid transport system ATP-binding protein
VQLRSVRVAFGGLLALGGVDLDVAQGERLAILGPNGAGKTTLFNVVAGDLVPTSGTVHLQGQDCTRAAVTASPVPWGRPDLPEGALLPRADRRGQPLPARWSAARQPPKALAGAADAAHRERARAGLASVWMERDLQTEVSELSHGQKRQLEIGMALATDPAVLLLDEPASGLSRGERERLTELLDALPVDVTLLLIEHDMDVAFQVARRVVVMSDGKVVAAGTPEQVQADPLVHEIYLGSEALA